MASNNRSSDQSCFPVGQITAEDLSPPRIEVVVAEHGHRLFNEPRLEQQPEQAAAPEQQDEQSSLFGPQPGCFGN